MGRIFAGNIKSNQVVIVLDHKGNMVEQGRVSKILAFRGIERTPDAGDIVATAGLEKSMSPTRFMLPKLPSSFRPNQSIRRPCR
jgi:predicted membrane GTPase involved in stress response